MGGSGIDLGDSQSLFNAQRLQLNELANEQIFHCEISHLRGLLREIGEFHYGNCAVARGTRPEIFFV